MANETRQQLGLKTLKSIMQKRDLIKTSLIGKRVQLTIQGNGNTIPVMDKSKNAVFGDDGMPLFKVIFNVKANSEVAMTNPRNVQFLKDAITADKLGDAEATHAAINAYLNAVQVSFSTLLPSKLEAQLRDGVEIAAKVQKIETDNGALLTIDPATISLVAPEVLSNTTFDLDALIGVFADDDDEEEEEEIETEEARKARIKAEKAAAKAALLAGK